MKWAFVLIISTLLVGCTSVKEQEEIYYTYGYDFTKYVSDGFLITPEIYNGEYLVVGLLGCSVTKEVRLNTSDNLAWLRTIGTINKYDSIWVGTKKVLVKRVESDSLINYMYHEAIRLGADGIMKFKIEEPDSDLKGPLVTGVAIKRMKK